MALNNTERTILTRLGYTEKSAPPNILNTVRMVAGQVDAGFIKSIDDGLVEARAILEGRSTNTSTGGGFKPPVYPVPGGNTGGGSDLGNLSDVQLVLMQYGGLSELEAQQAIAENPITASKYAQQLLEAATTGGGIGGGGGGSAGRTQFESESRLQNANAAQIEQELAAIAAGTSRFQPFQGGYFDPQTGEFFDPSDVGLGRFNADTSRMNADAQRRLADFQTGPQFQENIRQFDQELALNALGEERAGKTAAANAEVGFGNLGVDRAKFIQSILNQPSDTLARLYMQRGGVSPLAKIEMADLLNSFNKQATNISNSVSRFAPNPALKAGITPGPIKPVTPQTATPRINPEYQYANQPFITPTYSDPNNYLSPNGDPWSDAAQDRWNTGIEEGSIALADPAATPSNYSYDPNGGVDSVSDYNFEIQNGNLVAVPAHARGGYTQESRFIVGDQRSGKPTGHEELIVNPTNAPIQVVSNKDLPNVSRFDEGTGSSSFSDFDWRSLSNDEKKAIIDELIPSLAMGAGGLAKNFELGNPGEFQRWPETQALIQAIEQASAAKIGGDAGRKVGTAGRKAVKAGGKAVGNAANRLARLGAIPAYDEGTGSFGDLRNKTLDAEPTGGFLNSLKEALGDLGEWQEGNRNKTSRFLSEKTGGLTDNPTFNRAVGDAVGVGHAGVGTGGMFSRMSMAEKLKMAKEKGLSVDHLPIVDRLKAQYEEADIALDKLLRKRSIGDNEAINAAKEKRKNLAELLYEERKNELKGTQTATEAMMDEYSNTLKQYKLVAKHADNTVERQTGGLYKTYSQYIQRREEILDTMLKRDLSSEEMKELEVLNKLHGQNIFSALERLDNQLSTVGQQMGRMRGGSEGIDMMGQAGISLGDSLKKAMDPMDDLSRYSEGTISRFAGGTDSMLNWANTNLVPDKTTMPTPYTGTTGDQHAATTTIPNIPAIPSYNDTHSLFPTGDVTQQQLIDMSRIGTGPGGTSVLSGQMPSRFRIPGLQTPTAMQFNSLSGAERENLRPRLAAEFNSTLEDLMFDIEQRYSTGPSRMAKFRG